MIGESIIVCGSSLNGTGLGFIPILEYYNQFVHSWLTLLLAENSESDCHFLSGFLSIVYNYNILIGLIHNKQLSAFVS